MTPDAGLAADRGRGLRSDAGKGSNGGDGGSCSGDVTESNGGTAVDDEVANTGTGTVDQPVRAICAKKLEGDNGAPSLRTGKTMIGGAFDKATVIGGVGNPSTACRSINSRRATTRVASVCGERSGCVIV